MSLLVGEKTEVLRMYREGLYAFEITRKILDSRTRGGFAETLLDIKKVTETEELTEKEKIMVNWLKGRGLSTLRIATILLEDRHETERYVLWDLIKKKDKKAVKDE